MKKTFFSVFFFLAVMITAFGQEKTISGRVTGENGDPVQFVSVCVRGKKTGVSGDQDGYYKISIPENSILVFSASGYKPRELSTAGLAGEQFNVTLERGEDLTVVLVATTLGQKRKPDELGYAVSTINNKTLTQGKSVNVQQALNGKISSLNISTTNSGVFENAKILIRGVRSLTGNNQPMLVVDGAPMPLGLLSTLPPGDIQDISILKSAASAALYGPDAVNGVIIINTKKGDGKKLSVTFNSTVQLTRVAYFPKIQNRFGGGTGAPADPYGNNLYTPWENQLYGPEFDGSIKPIGRVLEDGSFQSGPYSAIHHKDKIKFWNTGFTVQNSVSIAGGDFYLSVEDANIKGVTPKDKNRRTSFRFNGAKQSGKFSVNYGVNYVLQNFDVINEAGVSRLLPGAYGGSLLFAVLQTASNVPLLSYQDWRNNKFAQFSNYYNDYSINPYWLIDNVRQRGREDDLTGNIEANYEFAKWLKATARLTSTISYNSFGNSIAPIVVSDWAHSVRSATQYTNRLGSVFNASNYDNRINLEYFLSGEKNIHKNFSIKYIAGSSVRQNRSKSVAVGGQNLVVPYLYNLASRSGEATVGGYPANAQFQSRMVSAYGSFGIGYKQWAFLELTGRNDWDSRLAKENRSFFYPAASSSFVLSEAIPAIKNSNVISYAKLRAAYSQSGNVNLEVYSLQSTFSQPTGFPFGNTASYTANNIIPANDLKPEFITTKEVGIDLSLFKNRVNLEATYFHQKAKDQILQVVQSAATGYPTALANAASFKNYGIEMDLGLTPLVKIGKGKIDVKLNVTYNDNKVLSTAYNLPVVVGGTNQFTQVSANSPTANNIAIVGGPAFAFQLSDYVRDPEGRVIVDKYTGLPKQAEELVVMGRSLPRWLAGITPSYSIGMFTVSMTWDLKAGHHFYAGAGSDMDFSGMSARSASFGRKRFVFPNSVYLDDATGKYVPNLDVQVQDGNNGFWTSGSSNTAIATNYFASATALRLRELNLTYSLPNKWFANWKVIQKISLSAVGKNLFLFVPKSNQWGDPEFNGATGVNTFGLGSVFQSPASRFFGGSLTIQL